MNGKTKVAILIACLLCIGSAVGILISSKLRARPQPVVKKAVFNSAAPAGPPDPSWSDNELCMAVYDDNLQKFKQLLDAQPDALNQGFGTLHSTLLHLAARYGTPDIARELLQRGADINARTTQGHTPLFDAIDRSHIMMVTLLLEHGADTGIPDDTGQTPLQMAIANHHTGSTALLQKYGAKN